MTDRDISFASLAFTIIAIIVTIVVASYQSKRKRLLYKIVVDQKVLSSEDVKAGKVKIKYLEKEVDEIAVFILFLRNFGNIPISKNDFESPINFDFSQDCDVLSVEIIQKMPQELTPILTINKSHSVSISPLLLNPGDFFYLKFLTSKLDNGLKVTSRIKGVKQIERRSGDGGFSKANSVLMIIIYIAGLICSFNFILTLGKTRPAFIIEVVSSVFLFGAISLRLNNIFIKSNTIPKDWTSV
ncbi:MAG TPA: hypothetical protein VK772_07915 [Puia sp.]|jgi:hypothetical protein|nr:hypothetical protein [Puia sp.]